MADAFGKGVQIPDVGVSAVPPNLPGFTRLIVRNNRTYAVKPTGEEVDLEAQPAQGLSGTWHKLQYADATNVSRTASTAVSQSQTCQIPANTIADGDRIICRAYLATTNATTAVTITNRLMINGINRRQIAVALGTAAQINRSMMVEFEIVVRSIIANSITASITSYVRHLNTQAIVSTATTASVVLGLNTLAQDLRFEFLGNVTDPTTTFELYKWEVEHIPGTVLRLPGQSSDPTLVAGVDVLAYRAITTNSTGLAVHADAGDTTVANRVLGVSKQAGLASTQITYQQDGFLTNLGWNFTPSEPIYLGLDGEITQSQVGAVCVHMGYAVSATTININIDSGIIRA